MKKTQLIRFLFISIFSGIILSVISFFCLRVISESSTFSHRQEFILGIAKEFEGKDPEQAVSDFNDSHSGQRGMRNQFWIVDPTGKLLATTGPHELPLDWNDAAKPENIHDFTTSYLSWGLEPEITIVKLSSPTATYLISKFMARRQPNRMIFAQLTLTFVIVAIALFLALSITFFYLQRKSKEAKEVLSRLEKGDLAARFKIQSFDEAGSLMLDFNRMASQIEYLVHRVQSTERMRRELLQELGHDLRTPLTSLSTSLETLQTHFDRISTSDRTELLALMRGELGYFIQLLEDLFFISEIDEPDYRNKLETIQLAETVQSEIRAREKISNEKQKWIFENENASLAFFGDRQSILRLIKNLLDNASRFAKSNIVVRLVSQSNGIVIEVQDDGPGMTLEEIENFGERRKQRSLLSGRNFKASLGLGSVIIRKIVELYEGKIEIKNCSDLNANSTGTLIRVFLKSKS